MNALDLMKAIGEMPEEVIASCCIMEPNQINQHNTLVQSQLNETEKEDLPLQKESFVNSKLRRRDTMKQKSQKTKTAGRLLPWHIAIGITAAACAILAVSVGIDVIERNSQMQVGTSISTTASKQDPEREPIEIDYRIEGFDVAMDLPENGKAELLHSIDDAKPWIDLVRQSGEYGRETGQGAENFRELLESEDIYQDHDIIMTAVPYHNRYSDYGNAMYNFSGATITPSGKLTVDVNFLTVGYDMPERMLQQIDTFCCCFAVPKNTVPDIWSFTFNDVIYDCTDQVPDGCDTREKHLEYLYSLPNYQKFNSTESGKRFLKWAEDEPVLLGEEVCAFSANRSGEEQITRIKVPEVPEENDVQVFRSLEEMQQAFAGTDILESDHCMAPKINSETFQDHDVLYLAYRQSAYSETKLTASICSGEIKEDGTLTVNYSELVNDSPDAEKISENVNYYEFYLVPKDSLTNLSRINMQMNEFHTNTTLLSEPQYEYLNSIPEQVWITWENGTKPPVDCDEIKSVEQPYAELELHENEKRVCTMEQVDAIMESGYAEFKQNGRKTIDKDRYIALIHNGNRQADDLEIKSFIYHMMLNSIDYFNSAEGSMTYAIPKESPVEIDFQTDIALQECYESDRECDEEIEQLYVSDGITHRIDHKNKNYKNTRLAIPAEFVVNDNSRTMLLDNGEAMTLNRNDLTNLGIAGSSCLFPQLYAVNYLSDFDNWHFSEAKDYLERDCVKIEGKHQEKHFEMIIDVNTGILLSYEVYNNAIELKGYVKISELEIDTPVKVRHFDETLYTNYSCD